MNFYMALLNSKWFCRMAVQVYSFMYIDLVAPDGTHTHTNTLTNTHHHTHRQSTRPRNSWSGGRASLCICTARPM
jgi:hypothetical protein